MVKKLTDIKKRQRGGVPWNAAREPTKNIRAYVKDADFLMKKKWEKLMQSKFDVS